MSKKKTCGDCFWFRNGSQVGEGWCFYGKDKHSEPTSVPDLHHPACSHFGFKYKPGEHKDSKSLGLGQRRKP